MYQVTQTEGEDDTVVKTYRFGTEEEAKERLEAEASAWLDAAYREGYDLDLSISENWHQLRICVLIAGSSYRTMRKITEI